MEFSAYLQSKKIDPALFEKKEAALFHELKAVFDQVHPDSFTAQKLFLINPIRRKYQLKEDSISTQIPTEKPKIAKPKI